jgi:hypothetical protein
MGGDVFTMRCIVCGSETTLSAEPGTVGHITIEHENDCAFYQAIEAEQGEDWVRANGYPMRTEGPVTPATKGHPHAVTTAWTRLGPTGLVSQPILPPRKIQIATRGRPEVGHD